MSRAMYFEDFRVGMTFSGEPRTVTAADHEGFMSLTGDRGAVHSDVQIARDHGFRDVITNGPLGIGFVFGQLYELGIVEPTAIATVDLDWHFRRPIVVGDTVAAHILITRCRRSTRRSTGAVGRHITLTNQHGVVVQEGMSTMLIRANDAEGEDEWALAMDFATVAWAKRVAEALKANEAFRAATAWFDGSFGLQAGQEFVQLRIYRGEVLEIARTVPSGPTFTLSGPESSWVQLALGGRNDFLARTSKDEFHVSGNIFEYLRMTKAIVSLWDSIRDVARGARS